jgi:SAM-dependent methyltransferase
VGIPNRIKNKALTVGYRVRPHVRHPMATYYRMFPPSDRSHVDSNASIMAGAEAWDKDYRAGRWDHLDDEVARHMLVVSKIITGRTTRPRVLDAGCGAGGLARLLAAHGYEALVGFDFAPSAIETARALNLPNARFLVGDIRTWDTEEYFDVVVLADVVYLVDHPRDYLNRATRWLKPDGVIIIVIFRSRGSARSWANLEQSDLEVVDSISVRNARDQIWDIKTFALQRSTHAPPGRDATSGSIRSTRRGGDGNRTRVQGFANPCLNHSATPPRRASQRTQGGRRG